MNFADSLVALPDLAQKHKALKIRRTIALQRLLNPEKISDYAASDRKQRQIQATRKVASSLYDLRHDLSAFLLRRKMHKLCVQEQQQ